MPSYVAHCRCLRYHNSAVAHKLAASKKVSSGKQRSQFTFVVVRAISGTATVRTYGVGTTTPISLYGAGDGGERNAPRSLGARRSRRLKTLLRHLGF